MKKYRKRNGAKKHPTFVARAERAFDRVARKVRTENRRLGLRPVVWANGMLNAKAVRHRPLRGSLEGTKAMDVFMSEREREREL
jgi:hypothetical protein